MTVFADTDLVPLDFSKPKDASKADGDLWKYCVLPYRFNTTYMHNLFLTDIVPKEPLKRFKDLAYQRKARGVPNGDVRDRKA